MTTQQTVKIKLVRSPIGCKESHRATVRGLGLGRRGKPLCGGFGLGLGREVHA